MSSTTPSSLGSMPINVSGMSPTIEMFAEAASGSTAVSVMESQAWHQAARQNADGEQCWVWCFLAPWEWALMQSAPPSEQSWLAWVEAQRHVLQLRRLLGARLQFVRASQLPHFLASIDQAAGQEAPQALPLLASANDPELATALAKLHLDMVPFSPALETAWEVFETLEAAAWLPEGTAPLFRDSLANTQVDWPLLLPLLHAGLGAPALREQLSQHQQKTRDQHERHEKEVTALHTEQQANQRERDALEEENALLLAQLHHVQEELESSFLNQQTLEQREKVLQDDVSQLQKRLAEQQATLDKAHSERDQLAKQQASQLQATAQQHQKALDEAAQKLQASETRLSQQQSEQNELQEENDLLLSQLHHVQEELERYFLANREYQAAMGSARQTFTRARAQVSQLAKKAS